MTGRRRVTPSVRRSAVDNVEELEVVERTAQRVRVRRTRTSDDQVGGTCRARVALAAHVELPGRADRLGVASRRQGG